MAGVTTFVTYLFQSTPITGSSTQPFQYGKSLGYSTAIHCNYIQKLESTNLANKSVSVIMPNSTAFPFLRTSSQINTSQIGIGWSARRLYVLVQFVTETGDTVSPVGSKWKIVDVTNQLNGYNIFSGTTIPPQAFDVDTIINIPVNVINVAQNYNLDYLKYPSSLSVDDNRLAFGEESFFFGNIQTDIKAVAYTTDISILLPLNQYNSTTNPTWDALTPIQISEVGLFDDNNNQIAVGKLNYPISKDSTIFRTVEFSIDF
jgi:hypothetical protein